MDGSLPFPDYAFPNVTVVKTMRAVKQPTGGTKPTVVSEYVVMGAVQEASVTQTDTYMTRGARIDSVVYYPSRQDVKPDDLIEWPEAEVTLTVVDQRQEAGMGLLWAVYCLRTV